MPILPILTSFVCELLAFVFFWLADWRVAVGYAFVWGAEFNFKAARDALRAGSKQIADQLKNDDDENLRNN